MSKRSQNERKFGNWDDLPDGGRLVEVHEKYPRDAGHHKTGE
jgi:hypothetical protein